MQLWQKFLELPFINIFSRRRRDRSIRYHFFISLILIGCGIIAGGLLETYFRYNESQKNISLLQGEVASKASVEIEGFIKEIERMMIGASKSREIIYEGLSPEYRFELTRLLLIAPAISEAVALDGDGAVIAQFSRLKTTFEEDERDLSTSAAFQQSKGGTSYFGPVYFVKGSEPFMTLGVPIEPFAGDIIGVLQAEVNLKFIQDVVLGIKVGKAGHAYAVTRSGDLITHPDISLVLQRPNLAHLNQVKEAFFRAPGISVAKEVITHNLQGKKVFSSHVLIPSLDWAVFIEQPVEEVYELLIPSILRTTVLLLTLLAIALVVNLSLSRRVVRPLSQLLKATREMAKGVFQSKVTDFPENELGELAKEFNRMAENLSTLIKDLEYRNEISRALISTRNLEETLERVVKGVAESGVYDRVRLYLFDEGQNSLLPQAVWGSAREKTRRLKIPLSGDKTGVTQWVFREKTPYAVEDASSDEKGEPELVKSLELSSYAVVPLLIGEKAIGVVAVDYIKTLGSFPKERLDSLVAFANTAALAIENDRLVSFRGETIA